MKSLKSTVLLVASMGGFLASPLALAGDSCCATDASACTTAQSSCETAQACTTSADKSSSTPASTLQAALADAKTLQAGILTAMSSSSCESVCATSSACDSAKASACGGEAAAAGTLQAALSDAAVWRGEANTAADCLGGVTCPCPVDTACTPASAKNAGSCCGEQVAVMPSALLAANETISALRLAQEAEATSGVVATTEVVAESVVEELSIDAETLAETQADLEAQKDQLDALEAELKGRSEAMADLQKNLNAARQELQERRNALDTREEELELASRVFEDEREAFLIERRKVAQQSAEATEMMTDARKLMEEAQKLSAEANAVRRDADNRAADLAAERQAAREAQEIMQAVRQDRLADVDGLVDQLRGMLLPEAAINQVREDVQAQASAFIETVEASGRIQRAIEEAEAAFKEELVTGLAADRLNEHFNKHLRTTFSPAEMLELIEFYSSKTGQKVLENGSSGLAFDTTFVEAQAASLLADFQADIARLTSPEAITEAIEANLELIAAAGKRYLEANGGDQVRVGLLISDGYLASIPPLAGETYSRLIVQRRGGILRVRTATDRLVGISY